MVAGRGLDDTGTAVRILDVAERLVQVRGFNGFSYADIAAELQITKAALHYHFASKAALGEALIARYAGRFMGALASLDTAEGTPSAKLDAYAGLYLRVLRNRKICLCGMLAAEYQTLPPPMQDAVTKFFDQNESWLDSVLEQGRADGSLHFAGSVRDTARMIIGGLEGAMLIARPYGDTARFQAAAASLLAALTPAGEPARSSPRPATAQPALPHEGPGQDAALGGGRLGLLPLLRTLVADGRRVVECLLEPGHVEPGVAQRLGRHVQPGDAQVRVTQRDGALIALTPVLGQRCLQVAVPAGNDGRGD